MTGLDDGWYTLRARVRRSTGNNNSYVELDCGRDSEPRLRAGVVARPVARGRRVGARRSAARARSRCTRTATAESGRTSTTSSSFLAPPKLSVLGADVSSLKKSEDLGGVYRDERRHRTTVISRAVGARHPRGPRRRSRPLARLGRSRGRLPRSSRGAGDGAARARAGPQGARGSALLGQLGRSRAPEPSRRRGRATPPSSSAQAVYDHTYNVCRSLPHSRRGPAMIQIGNELNAGMLWPDGHTLGSAELGQPGELPEGGLRRRQGLLAEHEGRAPPRERRRQRTVPLVVRQHHAARRRAST